MNNLTRLHAEYHAANLAYLAIYRALDDACNAWPEPDQRAIDALSEALDCAIVRCKDTEQALRRAEALMPSAVSIDADYFALVRYFEADYKRAVADAEQWRQSNDNRG